MKPLFIPDHTGALFSLYFPPVIKPVNRAILHIPAFAEEMNKSRRMVTLQAREFANQGYAVLILDLFGTGDSAGDFGDATWEIWLQNINTAIEWLKQQGAQTINLWGVRTGALLAMDFACQNQQQIDHLLCWQPVLNGETFVTQFLRLRVAAAIMDNNAPREKTSDLKRQLQEGQAVEVAGYLLNPDLIIPLITLRADRLDWQTIKEIAIIEVASGPDNPVPIANTQLLSALQEQNINASLTKVVGGAFWASQEITAVPDLITASSEKIKQWF